MENILLIGLLLVIAAGAVWYLVRAKKRGAICVGCSCAKNGGCACCKKSKEQ